MFFGVSFWRPFWGGDSGRANLRANFREQIFSGPILGWQNLLPRRVRASFNIQNTFELQVFRWCVFGPNLPQTLMKTKICSAALSEICSAELFFAPPDLLSNSLPPIFAPQKICSAEFASTFALPNLASQKEPQNKAPNANFFCYPKGAQKPALDISFPGHSLQNLHPKCGPQMSCSLMMALSCAFSEDAPKNNAKPRRHPPPPPQIQDRRNAH